MSTIKNKRQSNLTKQYNKLVKEYNILSHQLKLDRTSMNICDFSQDTPQNIINRINSISYKLYLLSEKLKCVKYQIKSANKEYQISH